MKVAASFLVLVFIVFSKSAGGATDPTTGVHSFSLIDASKLRHISVFPKYRNFWRTVVREGMVQVSTTLSPLRAARRSEGGLGNSSEGGSGGPIEAQPVQNEVAIASSKVARKVLIRRATDYTRARDRFVTIFFYQRRIGITERFTEKFLKHPE